MFRAAFLAALVLWATFPATSQSNPSDSSRDTAQSLSLEQAIRTAIEKHPALRQAESAVAAAEAEVTWVRASYFPQVSFTGIAKAGLSGATSALVLSGFPASPFYRNLAYSANWYQNIFDFGRTKHLVALRQALVENSRLKKRAEEQRIVLGVRRAYFAALEAEKLQNLAEETVKARQLTLARVQAYFRAGMQSRLEVSLEEADLAEAQGNLIQARNAVHTAFAALRTAMGTEEGVDYRLEEPSVRFRSLPPEQESLEKALARRPDYLAADVKVKAFSEQVAEAQSERMPEVRGFGTAGQGRFSGTSVKPNQRHGVGAVGIFLPLFTGGRLAAERREARAELEGAQASRDLLRLEIRQEMIGSRDRLADAEDRIRAATEQEHAAEEASRLARARYQAQMASFLELTTAEVSLTRARAHHAREIFDYERALAELDFATGETSP